MKKSAYNTLRLLRPRQWVKNFAIFAAIIFTGQLFNLDLLTKVLIGFGVFCALSSAIYIMNDIFDIKKDKLHPFKRFRPLAHGDISVKNALILSIILLIGSLWVGSFVSQGFFILAIFYVILQISYSAIFKQIAVIDILAIAAGYILRVYAGEFATGLHISVWLLLTAITVSLFLAVGKRRSELTLISTQSAAQIAATRPSLSHYSERLLDVYASLFATSTFISYALFTFLENPSGIKISGIFLPDFLPAFFQRKWLMITIFPVVYGIMRYLQDIYEKHEGESPERVIFSDTPLLITIVIWVVLVIGIIYFIGA